MTKQIRPDPLKHLSKDKTLKKLIGQVKLIKRNKQKDLFIGLLKAIVSQQLSVKAADTIWNRFLALFKNQQPTASAILKLKDDQLKAVGLSYQKASYIKNIATFSLEYTLDYKKLRTKTDDELIDYLVQIKGVGRWTVEMLLMFALDRGDIFPKKTIWESKTALELYTD